MKLKHLFRKGLYHFPKAKKFAKLSYKMIGSNVLNRKKGFDCVYEITPYGHENRDSFFGYYDKSPLNYENSLILYHEAEFRTDRYPLSSNPIKIVVENFEKRTRLFEIESLAFNFQQGSRTHWLSNSDIIFNDIDSISGQVIGRKINLINQKETLIERGIYESHPNGYALTLNFSFLKKCQPDYAYENEKTFSLCNKNLNIGIFRFKDESHEILINYNDIINLLPRKSRSQNAQAINHLMFSPDGTRFVFLFRTLEAGKRVDYLFVYCLHESFLKLLKTGPIVSHFCWQTNQQILVYMSCERGFLSFFQYDTSTGHYEPFWQTMLTNDGHPHIHGDKILLDTYPNFKGYKDLLLIDLTSVKLHKIGKFYESYNYRGSFRCDLHPRFSYDGGTIFFDSVHTGRRRLYSISLGSDLEANY